MKLNILFFIFVNFLSCMVFARLTVYKSDGTTVLGYYAGCVQDPCDKSGKGWGYTNTSTGALSIITKTTVSDGCINDTIYYSSVTCAPAQAIASGQMGGTCSCDGINCYNPGSSVPCSTANQQLNGSCTSIGAGAHGYGCGLTQRTYICGLGSCILK